MSIRKIFTGLQKKLSGNVKILTFTLNDRIGPIDRGIAYEDPLAEYLQLNRLGDVVGSGTFLEKSGELSGCDIHVELTSLGGKTASIQSIISEIERLGAPKGSKVTITGSNSEKPIGKLEGMAIYLDGVNLTDEVYQTTGINIVTSEISKAIGYSGDAYRSWQGEKETAIYFYGDSFEKMKEGISDFIGNYPLCANSRIVQIA